MIRYFTIFFFSITFMFPIFSYDPFLEYDRLHSYYPKLTPYVFKIIYEQCDIYKLSLDDICSLINLESNWNTNAISHTNARGLMQIMRFHYKGNLNDLYIPEINIPIGCKYFKWCLTYAKGNKNNALMYYNAGPSIKNYKNGAYITIINKNSKNTEELIPRYLEIK